MIIYGVWYADECNTDFYLNKEKAIEDAWDFVCDVYPEIATAEIKGQLERTGSVDVEDGTIVAVDPYEVIE